jgi:hypothetical protein
MTPSAVDHKAKVRSWAGLDVHAGGVIAVTVDALSGQVCTRRLPGATSEVARPSAVEPPVTGRIQQAYTGPLRGSSRVNRAQAVRGVSGRHPKRS